MFFGGFTLFFLGAAIFGSQSPGLAAALAAFFGAWTASIWRQGLYVESTGVRIILPGRLKARRITWAHIDRFEVRYGVGKSPVTLIRAPNEEDVRIPTFPVPRRADLGEDPRFSGYRARVEGQVNELNQLMAHHRRASA